MDVMYDMFKYKWYVCMYVWRSEKHTQVEEEDGKQQRKSQKGDN